MAARETSTVNFCGIELKHPIINASGTFDVLAAHRVFGDGLLQRFPFAAFVTKTVTIEPRTGNPPARLWEAPSGLVNSIGLPNKGLDRFLAEDLVELNALLSVPLIVNIMGSDIEQFVRLSEAVETSGLAAALELNVSCPNVKTGLDIGADPKLLFELVKSVKNHVKMPIVVKLTPNTASVAETAKAAANGGADAVSLINTVRAMAVDQSGKIWLGNKTGGLSGPAVRAVALAQVAAVRNAAADLPIVGMGGVQRTSDARALFECGADLVAVGTETFRNPLVAREIAEQLAC